MLPKRYLQDSHQTRLLYTLAVTLFQLFEVAYAPDDEASKYSPILSYGSSTPLPYAAASSASNGMNWSIQYGLFHEDFGIEYIDAFADSFKTTIMDQSQCVYYSTWNTSVREAYDTALPEASLTLWPPLWTDQLFSPTKMDVYLADIAGINRVVFHNDVDQGYHNTASLSSTLKSSINLSLSLTNGINFYFSLNDDVESNADVWWMLKLMEHNGSEAFDAKAFGDHPYHLAAIVLQLYLDPTYVDLVGFQTESSRTDLDSGANFIGLYYRLKSCSMVPSCDDSVFLSAIAMTQDNFDSSGTTYTHQITLDASASCLVLEPAILSVTHDYIGSNDIAVTVDPVTAGDYTALQMVVTSTTPLSYAALVTFTLNFSIGYVGPIRQADVLQLTMGCTKNSISIEDPDWPTYYEFTENDPAQTIALPILTLDVTEQICWNLFYEVSETTTDQQMSVQVSPGLAVDSASAATTINVPALPMGVIQPGYYDFEYTVSDQFDTLKAATRSFQVRVRYLDPCIEPDTLTSPLTLQDQVYTTNTLALQYQFSEFTVEPLCPIAYSYSADSLLDSGLSLDIGLRTFSFFSSDDISLFSLPNLIYTDFVVTVTGTVGLASTQSSFQLRVANHCAITSQNPIILQDFRVEYPLRSGPMIVSIQEGILEPSTDYCGNLDLTLYGDESSAITFSSEEAEITIETELQELDGLTRTLYIDVSQREYPEVQTETLTIEVYFYDPDPCLDPLSLASQGALVPQEYVISDPTLVYAMIPFLVDPPECEISYSLGVSTPLIEDSFTFDSADFLFSFVNQDDLQLAGTADPFYKEYVVTIGAEVGSASASDSFILKVINPCGDADLNSIEGPIQLKVSYLIGESPFVLPLRDSFASERPSCGGVHLEALGIDQDEAVYFNSGSQELTVLSEDTSLSGTSRLVQIVPTLAEYPQITRVPYSIMIEFLSCAPGQILPKKIADLSQEIGAQEASIIKLPEFFSENLNSACELEWTYSFNTLQSEPSTADSTDYFLFDTDNHELALTSLDPTLEAATFQVVLVGRAVSKSGKHPVEHSIPLRLYFSTQLAEVTGPEPVPVITLISDQGAVTVRFNTLMVDLKPENATDLVAADTLAGQRRRSLQESVIEFDQYTLRVLGQYKNETQLTPTQPLEVYLETSNFEHANELGFYYDVVDFKNSELSLKLEFAQPRYVSQGPESDTLVVSFTDSGVFKTVGGRKVEEKTIVRSPIRAQIGPYSETLSLAAQTAGASLGASIIANTLINIGANTSMSLMVSLIKQLQLLIHLILMDVTLAANTAKLFSYLIGVLTFDPIELGDEIRMTFGLDDSLVRSQKLPLLLYESPHMIVTLGSMNLIIFVSLSLLVLQALLAVACCCWARARRFGQKQFGLSMCNRFLAFMDGSFLVLVISALINLEEFTYEDRAAPQNTSAPVSEGGSVEEEQQYFQSRANFSYRGAALTISLCIFYLVLAVYVLLKCRKQLDEPRVKDRVGYLYETIDLGVYKSRICLIQPLCFHVRTFIAGYLLIVQWDWLFAQYLTIEICSAIVFILLGLSPFKDKSQNWFELVGEFTILITLHCLLAGSDPRMTPFQRELAGWIIIVCVLFVIAQSQIYIQWKNVRIIIRKCKQRCQKSRVRSQLAKERQAKRFRKAARTHNERNLASLEKKRLVPGRYPLIDGLRSKKRTPLFVEPEDTSNTLTLQLPHLKESSSNSHVMVQTLIKPLPNFSQWQRNRKYETLEVDPESSITIHGNGCPLCAVIAHKCMVCQNQDQSDAPQEPIHAKQPASLRASQKVAAFQERVLLSGTAKFTDFS